MRELRLEYRDGMRKGYGSKSPCLDGLTPEAIASVPADYFTEEFDYKYDWEYVTSLLNTNSEARMCRCGTDVGRCGTRYPYECCLAAAAYCNEDTLAVGIIFLVFGFWWLAIFVTAFVFTLRAAAFRARIARQCPQAAGISQPNDACICGCKQCECEHCCQCCECC